MIITPTNEMSMVKKSKKNSHIKITNGNIHFNTLRKNNPGERISKNATTDEYTN